MSQYAQGAEYGCRIFFLAQAAQFIGEVSVVPAIDSPLSVFVWSTRSQYVAFLSEIYGGRLFAGFLFENTSYITFGLPDDDGNTAFYDTGLFVGDRGERVSKLGHVVVTYVGNDACPGSNDIGAVETATQTRFDDGYIDVAGSEVVESHHHGKLEKRRVDFSTRFEVLVDKFEYGFPGNHFAVDPYAFAEVYEMG